MFYGCENLANVTLGNGIKFLGVRTFANCPNLKNLYCYAVTVPTFYSNNYDTFNGSNIENANLYVPAESLDSYRNTYPWNSFGNIMELVPTNLVDSEECDNANQYDNVSITYTRNFTDTNWNALYVPFAMDYAD